MPTDATAAKLLETSVEPEMTDDKLAEDYRKLDQKCDLVINKIRDRKAKKRKK